MAEQWGMHSALISAAMHWSQVTAHLYEMRMFMGVFTVTQDCCQPVLHSSTEQWGMHFALNSAAVHGCWVIAHLYEMQMHMDLCPCHCILGRDCSASAVDLH